MKKMIILAAFAVIAVVFSGCAMCIEPQDPSCKEASHRSDKMVTPAGMAYAAPTVLASPDMFIPHFQAGELVVAEDCIGSGTSIEEAISDAIMKFKAAYNCDFVVIVNKNVEKKTHPSFRLFKTSNYVVKITRAIPIRLASLERVVATDKANESNTAAQTNISITKEEITSIIKTEIAAVKNQNAGMIKLSDINVQINAKGVSTDKAAVIYPVK